MIDKDKIKLFQIYYDRETQSLLDPDFTPLDNSDNLRPDWAEYWPIQKLFAAKTFDDDDLIGVFSPRFLSKTGVTGAYVRQVLADTGGDCDVFNFSPYFDQATLFLNPYEQGENYHSGLYTAFECVAPHLGVAL